MATPETAVTPATPVENQEMLPADEVVPASEMVPADEMVQAKDMVPADDTVPADGTVPTVPADNMVPAHDNMVPAHDTVLAHDTGPADEMVHADDMVPADEIVHAEHTVVPADEMVHAEDTVVPADEMVHAEDTVPAEEMVHAEDTVPAEERVHADGTVHAEEMVHADETVHAEETVHAKETVHGDEMVHADEVVHPDDTVLTSEVIPANEMVHINEIVHANEMVPENDMKPDDEMILDNVMVPAYVMVRDHELIPGNEIVLAEPLPDNVETPPNNQETQPNKRRKKKSIVWEHFTIETVGVGCRRACCKQCKQSFAYSTGSKVAGTSHLKRHIAKGTCPVVLRNQQNNQMSPYSAPAKMRGYVGGNDAPKRRYRTASAPYLAFDPEKCRREISRMIIMHDYPLHMVEHPGFVAFIQNLQPRFDMVSFNTVQGDCVATYLGEKLAIQKVIEGVPGRICLTLDMWSSCHTVGYVFITGQYIDSEWKIHRKILNVIMEPYPDSDTAFSHAVAACLSDWSMEGKLFSVTINQPLGDAAVDNLRALLSVKNPLVLNGQLLVGNCLARTLSSIAQDAFTFLHQTVKKVRDSVKYVKTSESHEEKFVELKQQLQVPSTKILALDDQTQWNTTYEMLLAASELKEVFSCLDTSDPDYRDGPSMEDWKQVETLCTYLKILFDTANLLTAPTIQTTNTFFHEAWKIQLELARGAASEDLFISSLTKLMQERFDTYWRSCCLMLAIAVVMDPRFKTKLVEFSFSKIYGEEAATYVRIVEDGIHELFHEYVALPLPLTPTYMEEVNGGNIKQEDGQGLVVSSNGLMDFDVYIRETTSQQSKSELDQYLEESLLPRVHEFDVVGWWKLNRIKYPTLSKMARDILSVPVSTVTSDSVFSTVNKEMDSYRCSLRPETVEALICAKDWLMNEAVDTSVSAPIKMEVLF